MKNHEILPFLPILAFLWVNPNIVNAKTKMAHFRHFDPGFDLRGEDFTEPNRGPGEFVRRTMHDRCRKSTTRGTIATGNDESESNSFSGVCSHGGADELEVCIAGTAILIRSDATYINVALSFFCEKKKKIYGVHRRLSVPRSTRGPIRIGKPLTCLEDVCKRSRGAISVILYDLAVAGVARSARTSIAKDDTRNARQHAG